MEVILCNDTNVLIERIRSIAWKEGEVLIAIFLSHLKKILQKTIFYIHFDSLLSLEIFWPLWKLKSKTDITLHWFLLASFNLFFEFKRAFWKEFHFKLNLKDIKGLNLIVEEGKKFKVLCKSALILRNDCIWLLEQ